MPETMTAEILDGKAVAAKTREGLAERVKAHRERDKKLRAPGLAVILVGDDPASHLYVKNKVAACKKVGIESFMHQFPTDVEQSRIVECVRELNKSDTVDGILVQLPLPKHLSEEVILEEMDPGKDADGLHPFNLGSLLAGKPGLRPCTPAGVITLLEHYGVEISGANAVVVGRSRLVGKPAALLLMEKNATVTVCHSRTKNLNEVIVAADILVVAMGKSQFVKGEWIKPGAVVIDVGIHHHKRDDGSSLITGDVEFEEAVKKARLITPVPGGVGPMTVAQLLSNTVWSYEKRNGLN